MPIVSPADLLRLREQRQWSTPYLVVQEPETMFTGTVSGLVCDLEEEDYPKALERSLEQSLWG